MCIFMVFTFNIKIYENFEKFISKLFWRETLFTKVNYHITKSYQKKKKLNTTISSRRSKHFLKGKKN